MACLSFKNVKIGGIFGWKQTDENVTLKNDPLYSGSLYSLI